MKLYVHAMAYVLQFFECPLSRLSFGKGFLIDAIVCVQHCIKVYLDEEIEVSKCRDSKAESNEQHQDADEDLASTVLAHHANGRDQSAEK